MTESYSEILVTNMPQSASRWNRVSTNLNEVGVDFKRFVATYGGDILITDLTTNEARYGVSYKDNKEKTASNNPYQIDCKPGKEENFSFNIQAVKELVPGQLGIWCTYIDVWKYGVENELDNLVVLQDDALPKKDDQFKPWLNSYVEHLPDDYHIAFLDHVIGLGKTKLIPGNKYVTNFTNRYDGYGAWAMVFSLEGMKQLLSFEQYDNTMDMFLLHSRVNYVYNYHDNKLNVYGAYNGRIGHTGPEIDPSEVGRF